MAERAKRSMSDIRPVRGNTLVVPKEKTAAKKHHKAAHTASKPAPEKPKPVAAEPELVVEKYLELEAPKRGGALTWVMLGLILTAATVYGVYWAYITYIK